MGGVAVPIAAGQVAVAVYAALGSSLELGLELNGEGGIAGQRPAGQFQDEASPSVFGLGREHLGQ